MSGLDRLYYNRDKPYEKTIPFYNHYIPNLKVAKPSAYIIPQGWWKKIDLLKANKVNMKPLPGDTILEVEVYRIEDYKSPARPFEGHPCGHGNQDDRDDNNWAIHPGATEICSNEIDDNCNNQNDENCGAGVIDGEIK